MMCAACIGTFVMAESGLLDCHQATTTWWLGLPSAPGIPNVLLDESNMLVKSGGFVTAGAALEPHGSRALARESDEPSARVTRREIPHREYQALPICLCPHRPSTSTPTQSSSASNDGRAPG